MDFGQEVPRPGETFAGKYRVDRVLGAGGMGVVLAVTHLELGERRAVKFMLPSSLGDTVALERFLREARAASKLKSDHVAHVYDVGRTEQLAPYMVLEYLEGEDLAATLRRGPIAIDNAVDYVIQACDAIGEAHAAGIVHRDLKPANLFLTAGADGSACIKVLDFGISKVAEAGTPSQLTATDATVGSPFHMSPEQMRTSNKVDRRTDVWSLGVVLYQLVTGELPFLGEGRYAVCFAIAEDAPRPMRTLRPDVPRGLEAAILRCLEKKPDARFQDVAALCDALAPFSTSQDTAARVRRIHRLSGDRSAQAPSTDSGPGPAFPASGARTGEGATESTWGSPLAKAQRGRRVTAALFASLVVLAGAIVAARLFVWPARVQPVAEAPPAPAPRPAAPAPLAPPAPASATAAATATATATEVAPPPEASAVASSTATAKPTAPRRTFAAPVQAPPPPPPNSDPWGRSRK